MSARPRGATFGKPDATGRSSGKLSRAERKLLAPPDGKPFAWQTAELLASDAWRGMSLPCHRFVDFLMMEHCNHAGRENGRLMATYDQLGRLGIHPRNQRRAIEEAVERGLVRITEVGGLHGVDVKRTPSRYRLTWLGTLDPPADASNEWKNYTVMRHFPAYHGGRQSAYHGGRPTQNAPKEIRHFNKPSRPTAVVGASRIFGREAERAERIESGRRLAGAVAKAKPAHDAYLALWCWVVVMLSHAQEHRAELIAPASPAEGAS